MSFLKFPSATVDTLLQDWVEYMKSPEHAKEKARAQKVDSDNEEEKSRKQRELKKKKDVCSLRHLIRQTKSLDATTRWEDMTWQQQQQWTRWHSGEMDQELESLTQQHGYGKLPGDKGILLPTRFTDTVALAK